ncbi:hypothetical protein AGOR_G00079850 [Albula goreensis]|uniref:Pleckstrin homology domain-containing family G member 5 n=1 Tax=Albula goreensis TaxID=1534307 RepID=A0A8T3DLX0_9TELE|nr:hypothetical protein AGOR_G00079850 [Albula goreensis]
MVFIALDMPFASMGQARRRKNMNEFLGDANIPSPDSLAQLGGSLPSMGVVGGVAVSGAGPDTWKNRAASRFSGLFSSGAGSSPFGKEVDRMEQLQYKLQSFTLLGLPKIPPQLSFHHDSWEEEEEEEDEPSLELEESWQCLLENPESLTRRQFHQQEAIWELLQTESTYIKKLRVITDLFLCGLLNLQDSGLLGEVEPARLFGNIQDLVRLHTALWAQVMLPALEKARQNQTLLNPTDLHLGFKTIGSRFKPYIRYCMEEEACLEYMRSLLRDNELFRSYVTWAEAHKQCNRLKLADMLVKPHQRLTKYPLLLKSILKKTDEPAAREAVCSMVAEVEGFINSVDSQMRQRQEQQKLAAISGRIESYEAVEGGSEEVERILREFSRFDLTGPMTGISAEETRQLHLEGALRMKEGKESRMDVYCFLFTDLLLITKPVKRVEKVKVIRQPLFIDNVVCRELKDPGSFLLVYLNEFRSAVAAYSFQANSAAQGRSWVEAICNVQNQLQKLRSEESHRQQPEEEESSNSAASSPCLRHKEQQSESQSDGSTETLSVVVTEDTSATNDSSSLETDPSGSLAESSVSGTEIPSPAKTAVREHPTSGQEGAQSAGTGDLEADLQCRSLSMDSAYGTLSPESLLRELEVRDRPGLSEWEETEGDGAETEGEEAGPEGEVEEERATQRVAGSKNPQRPVGSHPSKLRRSPPVQPRLHCLKCSAVLSRSEDNLLQRLQGHSGKEAGSVATGVLVHRVRETAEGLAHSRSLSQLSRRGLGSAEFICQADTGQLNEAEDPLAKSAPSYMLTNKLRRVKALPAHRALSSAGCSRSCEGSQASSSGSDGEAAPSTGREGNCRSVEDLSSADMEEVRRSTGQQHKKLTLAQLYRIRTSMVLNSTLTASEV